MGFRYYLKLSDGTVCFIDSDLELNEFKGYLKTNEWIVVFDGQHPYFYGENGDVFQNQHTREIQLCAITSISKCDMKDTDLYRIKDRYKIRYNLLKEIYSYKLNWFYRFLLNMYGFPKDLNNVEEVEWLWISTLEKTLKKVKKRSKGKLIK